MISDKDIEAKATEYGLQPNDVEKDYVHSWVLYAVSQRPLLRDNLILKGGNALRKVYFPSTRFSKDLDFSAVQHIDQAFLESELRQVCSLVQARTGVTFLDKAVVKEKDLAIPGVDALEARIYFKGFYNEENLTLKTQLDITQFDKILLPIQQRPLLHPYPDVADCVATIKCQQAEEILASKLTTLLHRRKGGDLFDLIYAILFARDFSVNRLQVITTFLKKSIFEPQPNAAKQELLATPLKDYESTWPSILAPKSSVFGFDVVVGNFAQLIDSLFAVLATATPRGMPARGRAGSPQSFGRSLGISLPSFFHGGVRSTIMNAGRSLTMIELSYGGYHRLVEPYKLQYYVRKKDGVGQEYFWGYDTTGGKSGEAGMKMFICDKIESVRSTQMRFSPRYPVEL
jgi:predicted nucleotidyltransferase component of viral defense system